MMSFEPLPLAEDPRARRSGSTGPSTRSIRPPVDLLRGRRLAEIAWIRHRLRTVPEDHPTRSGLDMELEYLERRLGEVGGGSGRVEGTRDEWWFHQASMERAVELSGADSRRAEEHAARLHELDPAWRPRDLLSMVARQLEQRVQSAGLVRYAEDYLYVFRRRGSGLQLVASPISEERAYELLREMEDDPSALDRYPTASRVEACAPDELEDGRRLVVEFDAEGFWISVESARDGRRTYDTAFPRFEDARAYADGTLREDLLGGKGWGEGWEQTAPADPEAERAERRLAGQSRLGGPSLWTLLTSVPGYRTVYEEGVSERSAPWRRSASSFGGTKLV